jgi:hypothetical protein
MSGLSFRIRHRVACESVEYKRTFIAEHWSPEHLFPDFVDLGGAVALDMFGKIQTILFVAIWCCGIECDSISQLSQSAPANKSCVDAGKGRTGSTTKGHRFHQGTPTANLEG